MSKEIELVDENADVSKEKNDTLGRDILEICCPSDVDVYIVKEDYKNNHESYKRQLELQVLENEYLASISHLRFKG